MTATKALKVVCAILSLAVQMPIYYYLVYKVMLAVNATELMWFLFWIYVPLGILLTTCWTVMERVK